MSFRLSWTVLALVSALTLAGCSSNQRLATQAVGFNLALEKAQNEMLLLNVIRANDRLPMYLTGISSLTGNVQTTLTTGLGAGYSRAKGTTDAQTQGATDSLTRTATDTLTRNYMPSASATVSKNPTFTLAVLDTQEFMRGFLSPITKDTLAYYWNQDWPPELLFYLLVQRVEVQAGGAPQVFRNYPDGDDPQLQEMERFGLWVRCEFLTRNPQVEAAPVAEKLGPELPAEEVMDLEKLVTMAKEGLLVEKVGNRDVYQLQRQRTDLRFKLGPRPQQRDPECANVPTTDQPSAQQQEIYETLIQEEGRMGVSGTTVNFVLRSPEALLYYLGQLMRVANRKDSPKVPYVCIQRKYQPLFVAFPSSTCQETLLDADSGRGRFSIPASDGSAPTNCPAGALQFQDPECEAGRSMQALRLLSQVMSLQKSAKDLPTTTLVRVIGQ